MDGEKQRIGHTERCCARKQLNPNECWCNEPDPRAMCGHNNHNKGPGHCTICNPGFVMSDLAAKARKIEQWFDAQVELYRHGSETTAARDILIEKLTAALEAIASEANNKGYLRGYEMCREDIKNETYEKMHRKLEFED